jgi:predicted hydrocarbon binding protein
MNRQNLIDALDKTTVRGFTEALGIAINSLTDKEGRYYGIRLHDDPIENIRLLEEIAKMMLGKNA